MCCTCLITQCLFMHISIMVSYTADPTHITEIPTPSVPKDLRVFICAVWNKVVHFIHFLNSWLNHLISQCAIATLQSFWDGGSIINWSSDRNARCPHSKLKLLSLTVLLVNISDYNYTKNNLQLAQINMTSALTSLCNKSWGQIYTRNAIYWF